jgi:hypothetical protein
LVTQTIDSKFDNTCDDQETEQPQEVCAIPDVSNLQYSDLIYYLTHGTSPLHLDAKKKRALTLKESQYQLVDGILFRQNYDLMLLKYLEKEEADKVLFDLHDGPTGGHFGGKTTAHKILHVGYYCPTLFKDTHSHAHKCKYCQTSAGRDRKATLPLQHVIVDQPFD